MFWLEWEVDMRNVHHPLMALALALALSGCAEASKIKVAKALVAEQLTDPDSAQFRDIEVIDKGDGKFVVCGKVNAKNRMGGYVGYEVFVVVGDKAFILTEPESIYEKITHFQTIVDACKPKN